eukprot:839199_1
MDSNRRKVRIATQNKRRISIQIAKKSEFLSSNHLRKHNKKTFITNFDDIGNGDGDENKKANYKAKVHDIEVKMNVQFETLSYTKTETLLDRETGMDIEKHLKMDILPPFITQVTFGINVLYYTITHTPLHNPFCWNILEGVCGDKY